MKKNPREYDRITEEYFKTTKEKRLSEKLCDYVWKNLVATSKGYGFNLSHTLGYSLVALQEMNLAYHYPTIYWNTACIIVSSGSLENSEEKEDGSKTASTDYTKLAKALGSTTGAGIKVSLANINKSDFSFIPDRENNQILFGLKGLNNVSDEAINTIIANRPYQNPKDFLQRVKPKKQVMISLIKAGAFDEMMDRKRCMVWYLWETCEKKKNLTLQNLPGLIKYKLIPQDTEEQQLAFSIYNFNKYLKAITKADAARYNGMYSLDARAIDFLNKIDCEDLIETDNLAWFIKITAWDKIYQKYMEVFRSWLQKNKNKTLDQLNRLIFKEQWEKYALGTISAWEMEAMCFYYHEHELAHINKSKYGISNFFSLPEEPVVANTYYHGNNQINIFELTKICGTCISRNKAKATVGLLTPEGVVSVKFRKEYFALFDRQIGEIGEDGVKHTVEKSWFERGSKIIVQGMRNGDQFFAKKYNSSSGHTLYKITDIDKKGDIVLQTERHKGEFEDET